MTIRYYKIVISLLFVAAAIYIGTDVPDFRQENNTTIIVNCNSDLDTVNCDSLIYEEAIKHLKEYEGFRSNIYIDNDGSKTVGYGHHIRTGEFILTPMEEEEADQLLRCDLDRRIQTAYEIHGDTLKYNEAIAIALFIFNCGPGTYNKSSIKKNIINGDPPDRIWIQYCHYEKDGVMVAHPKLRERREFELKMYNNE